jgi:hypothetical protein
MPLQCVEEKIAQRRQGNRLYDKILKVPVGLITGIRAIFGCPGPRNVICIFFEDKLLAKGIDLLRPGAFPSNVSNTITIIASAWGTTLDSRCGRARKSEWREPSSTR